MVKSGKLTIVKFGKLTTIKLGHESKCKPLKTRHLYETGFCNSTVIGHREKIFPLISMGYRESKRKLQKVAL